MDLCGGLCTNDDGDDEYGLHEYVSNDFSKLRDAWVDIGDDDDADGGAVGGTKGGLFNGAWAWRVSLDDGLFTDYKYYDRHRRQLRDMACRVTSKRGSTDELPMIPAGAIYP